MCIIILYIVYLQGTFRFHYLTINHCVHWTQTGVCSKWLYPDQNPVTYNLAKSNAKSMLYTVHNEFQVCMSYSVHVRIFIFRHEQFEFFFQILQFPSRTLNKFVLYRIVCIKMSFNNFYRLDIIKFNLRTLKTDHMRKWWPF